MTPGSDTATSLLPEQIDFDAGAVSAGTEDIESAGARLFALTRAVASGLRTWGEVVGEAGESFGRTGGSL